MTRERLAVQRVREEGLPRQGLLTIQAPAELLIELEFLRAPFDFFLAMIGAEEHEFARRRLDTGGIEGGLRRNAGPAAVAAEALERPAVAGAFESGDELGAPHLLQLVERDRLRPVHESRYLQPVCRRVDVGMAVVLRGGELV